MTACKKCNRAVEEMDVDEKGMCCFCAKPKPAAEKKDAK